MTQKERVLLVELLHAEYAHAHSTNGMRSLCVVIGIALVIAAVGPGLYESMNCFGSRLSAALLHFGCGVI